MLCFLALGHIRHLWLCYVSCRWHTFGIFGYVMLLVIDAHSTSLVMLFSFHWRTFGIFGYVMFLVIGARSASSVMLCFLSLAHIQHLWLCYVRLCFLSLAHIRHLWLCYVSCHWRTFDIFGYVIFHVIGAHSASLVMLCFLSLAHVRHLWLCYVSCH